ncbi:lytic murein transglycosylase [Microvirga sp. W0021]|uniref:Lytic murein transglycosylase n=1 Tax=Hohaiivirga grylli TaxID=3133970 RepID=A0ABV0BLK0_9HYPH
MTTRDSQSRRAFVAALLASGAAAAATPLSALANQSGFDRFLASLWNEARTQGISRKTFEMAFAGVGPSDKIIAHTKKQSEFVRPIWEYIDGAVGKARVNRGVDMAGKWAQTIARVEKNYGVPRTVILGVWGMESNFGSYTGKTYVIQALASLAYVGYRGDFFRKELISALRILQEDHISRDMMLGSWAGAMGQTQFMPSSFEKYAVDGNGDGIRNIWTSVPDALASTANYLHMHGWDPRLPWGFEVVIPEGTYLRSHRHDFATWQKLGVRRADGGKMPRSGEAQLLVLTGMNGPLFLVTDNFEVIRAYNSSDAYALGVSLLGDTIYGGGRLRTPWPRNAPRLSAAERKEVQQLLRRKGFYAGETDGNHGAKTREAIRAFQIKYNLPVDGYADHQLLAYMRKVR